MEVIPSIIYHFQSYVYMTVYTSAYLNYKFLGFHINRVEKEKKDREDENVKLVEPINKYMTPSTFEYQVMCMHNQYICNDQASSYKHLGLTIDELKVGQKF